MIDAVLEIATAYEPSVGVFAIPLHRAGSSVSGALGRSRATRTGESAARRPYKVYGQGTGVHLKFCMSLAIALHVLSAVIWVVGMFFADMARQPAVGSCRSDIVISLVVASCA